MGIKPERPMSADDGHQAKSGRCMAMGITKPGRNAITQPVWGHDVAYGNVVRNEYLTLGGQIGYMEYGAKIPWRMALGVMVNAYAGVNRTADWSFSVQAPIFLTIAKDLF